VAVVFVQLRIAARAASLVFLLFSVHDCRVGGHLQASRAPTARPALLAGKDGKDGDALLLL
jgi:hypothetical protein